MDEEKRPGGGTQRQDLLGGHRGTGWPPSIAVHHGPGSKGPVWAHNTHVGDARATDMAQGGMDNIGQLMRQRLPGRSSAIGVVYDPDHEGGNYVPTRMAGRYDALLWIPEATALRPLHHEQRPGEPELETEPTGF